MNPGFIVDGVTERKILQRICPQSRGITLLRENGKSVNLEAMAERVAKIIHSGFGDDYYPVIWLFDKEIHRKEENDAIIQKLIELLKNDHKVKSEVIIALCDTMIENWIIADWEALKPNVLPKPEQTDAIHGTSAIKDIFDKSNRKYSKTADGVNLFVNANPILMFNNSPSFRYFIEKIAHLSCHYIDPIKKVHPYLANLPS